jgi:uncharacterized repeat protein (TIGR01451 family)
VVTLGWVATARVHGELKKGAIATRRSAGAEQAHHQTSHAERADGAPAAQDPESLIRSGWVQVVRFESPVGATVEIASSSGVLALQTPAQVGLALGQTYRLRISNVAEKPGLTLYPSIRLVGYVMPPAHVNPGDYPIPLHFLDRDFDDVGTGRMVSNVIFLEDPFTALPVAFPSGEVPVVDVRPGEDPLLRASDLGRPMIVIQLGNRVPLDDRLESASDDPPAFMLPIPAYRSGNGDDAAVRQANWNHAISAAGAVVGSIPARSSPMCHSSMPITRLPYKVHPRMPFDECVPDGGDMIPYVHFNAYDQVTGLGASETVAQFSRPGEPPRVVASNQICLYAPRFGLVRSTSASIAGLYKEGPRGVDHRLRRAALEARESAKSRSKRDEAQSVRRRELVSIVAMLEPPAALDELRVIAAMLRQDHFENLSGRTSPNSVDQADEARIAMSIEAAKAWTLDQFPSYTAITEGGAQISSSAVTGEIQQVREPYKRPGELVLRKTVNPPQAKAGDIVEFVIEYFNVGEQSLESVSIIDSLTARLEYIPNSAATDRRAVFTAAPNEVESQELRWDISDPLPAGKSGVVWFEAKVR